MLEFIRIQRFKTLMDASFPLAGLNLFSGLNGMGKSSLLQVLLLLRQSYKQNTLFDKGLFLKGDSLALGTGQDVLAEDAEEESILFCLKWTNIEPFLFSFDYNAESEMQPITLPITQKSLNEPKSLSLFNNNFQYLSANRISPKTFYDISDYHLSELNSFGNHGEYAIHYIADNPKPLKLRALKHHKAKSTSFIENLDCWMAEIAPGIRVQASLQRQLNSVFLRYAFEQGNNITRGYTPQNVGFGLTYVLPVLTALLGSKPGDLLIIENPESHLHPSGQAMIGKMCAIAANEGVQLFIESHSDHFLNGVRVAVKEKIIQADNVKLFFLERERASKTHSSIVLNPSINEDGKIDSWPKGFFDEWDQQLEKLL